MRDDLANYCPHEIEHPSTLHGGQRQYPEGMIAFIAFDDGEDAVSVSSPDVPGLVAALRRAADEIEVAQ